MCNNFLTAILWTRQSGLRAKITQQVKSPLFNQNRIEEDKKVEEEKVEGCGRGRSWGGRERGRPESNITGKKEKSVHSYSNQ